MLRNAQDALNLLEGGFARLKVLVIGDLMLDRYIWGDVDRISPEAPVPVIRHARRTECAGGAANVTMNLAGLGVESYLSGYWGADTEQAQLKQILTDAKVNTQAVVSTARPTISKTRIVGRTQQLLRLDIESSDKPAETEESDLLRLSLDILPKMDAVVLSDYAKGVLTAEFCEQIIRAARKAGIPVLVDPKARDLSKYSGATTVCPNLNELSLATGVPVEETEALLAAAQKQLLEHDFGSLTVTMSENGIQLLQRGSSRHFAARAQEVFDVSGAGDTVIATLAACLAGKLDLETSVDLANLAAGVVVGKVGTVPIAAHDLISLLTQSTSVAAQEKILDRERLKLRVAEWRDAGETIVFTNGCFDLLHVGHITLLEDCRRFGSKLVLGMNTDASVRCLKGPSRPIVGEKERARIMAALAATDAVVLFDEETPLELIREIKPDVLVKGGDYTESTIVGAPEVRARGGEVIVVPLTPRHSTTGLLERARGSH